MDGLHINLAHSDLPGTTQAAEGMARRAWTVAEIEAMVEAGVIDEDERFELIGGRSSRCRRRAHAVKW